jgi:charged multivesicular body protein 3
MTLPSLLQTPIRCLGVQVMKMMTDMMKVPQLNATMAEMSREMMKAGMIDEIMDDAMESAMDTEDLEEETEAELDKVTPPSNISP